MKNARLISNLLIFVSLALSGEKAQASNAFSTDYSKKIDSLFKDALTHGHLVGASVFIIDSSGHIFKNHYGQRNIEKNLQADDHTQYEIGSVSKTFTRLLLAVQNDLSLQTPLSDLLPTGILNPEPAGKPIRVQDLALHTGFLISVPCVPQPDHTLKCYQFEAQSSDPYANVTRTSLLQSVSAYAEWIKSFSPLEVPRPGIFYQYSNVGMGLLGELLATRKGYSSYRDLLKTDILNPLQMMDTDVDLNCEHDRSCLNMTEVYSRKDQTWDLGSRWHLPAMNGAGGIRSSISDMATYLKAEMGLIPELSLQSAIHRSQHSLPDAEKALESIACKPGQDPVKEGCNDTSLQYGYLGWPALANRQVFFHAGETGHSQAMIAFTQNHDIGVVILSNSKPADGGHLPNDAALCAIQLAGHDTGSDWCARFASKYQK